MTQLTSQLDAALKADAPLAFGALQIALPGYTLRLLDGAGELSFGGATYVGRDPTYGVLGAIERIDDGSDHSAPAVRATLLVPTNSAVALLCSPAAQGSAVEIWFGAVDRASGQVVPDPYLLFLGELDVGTIEIDQNQKLVQLDIVSSFERFFDQDEGVRLNGPWHASVWTGELGLQFVTSCQQQLPWGQDSPRPVMITDMRPVYAPGTTPITPGSPYWRPSPSYA